jgi:hypothetical protein
MVEGASGSRRAQGRGKSRTEVRTERGAGGGRGPEYRAIPQAHL